MPQAQSGGSPKYYIVENNSEIPSTVLVGHYQTAVEDSEHIGFAVGMSLLLPASHVCRLTKHVTLANPVRVCVPVMHYIQLYQHIRGTRWRCWLRHCATSRKVAGSIPDGVTGIFH